MSFQGPDVNSSVQTSSSCSSVIGEAEKRSIEMEDLDDSEKKEKPSAKQKTVPLYKLFSLADSKDVALIVMGTGAAVANGCSLPLTTLLFGNLINSFGGTAADIGYVLPKVSKVALDFVYLAVGAGVASFIQVVCWMTTGERQAARIRTLYLKSILRQEIAFFDRESNAGEIVGRMSGDTVLIQDAMGEKVGKFIQLLSSFVGGFIVAFIQGWHLTLVMLTTIPALVVAGAIMSTVVTKMASQGQQAYAETSVIVEQTVGSIRTVASFTGEKQMLSKYSESLKKAYSSSVKEGLAAGLGIGTVMCLLFCGYALGIWYGSKLILDKGYTGGKIITVIFAILTGSLSLGQASPCMSSFAAAQAATFKMFETIDRNPEIDVYDTKGKRLNDIQGDIEFRDVCFSYPSRPNDQIFCRLSLFIQGGKSMALVGESGSGKSTVISLIERFYDPQGGEVLIDGVNLKEIQLRWIRGKIGLVSQEPILFSSTIRENIAYGKDDATIEEIRAAAELANASKFIDNMPQGMDTIVGEKGTQLSGGQKQRVAIARAILKDPRILLLDEATSALDAESERAVQEALDRIMTGRTTVIVAHHLTTVRNTDIIVVLHDGSIIQKGTHSELLKDSDGVYSQLVRLQEMKRDSDRLNLDDQDKFITLVDVGRQASQRASFNQSISRGSSVGNSSRHSFSVSFGLPIGLDIQQRTMEEPTISASSQASHVRIHRLAHLNKPEIPILTFGVIAAIINGVILPLFGVLLANVIYTFYQPPQELRRDSNLWALMFVVIGALSLIALPARSYFFAVAGSQLIRRIRLMTFERVVSMEIAWFDDPENSSGAIGARLSTNAAAVRSLVGDALALAVQNTATLVAGLVIAFAANWQLSLIILALIPLIWLNGWIQIEFMKGFGADTKMMYEEASQVANDAVGCIRTVASFSAEDKVMELYKKKCDIPSKTTLRQGLISGVGYGISFFLLYCVYALSFYAGARLVQDGRTTFGRVFRVFFALLMAAIGVSQSSTVAPDSTKAKSAAASVLAVLDRTSKIDPGDSSGMTLEDLKGNIEFQHVSFRYPTRQEVEVLRDFCLAIQSGRTVALIGESGSGKSTTISLLQRFYNPDSGQIMFDGIEIQRFRLGWLRQQMGLVSQEPVLFSDTIRANIAYGKEGKATEAEIVAAAKLANAHKFVSSLQQGYDALVGERGAQLSGGQKQRIAIARAIIKNPKILLLDEATNSLDSESACVIQEALDRVMLNRTTIFVAHQLSTIKGADLIAVIKNGVIIEKGKHEALINIKNGAYSSLVALHCTQG